MSTLPMHSVDRRVDGGIRVGFDFRLQAWHDSGRSQFTIILNWDYRLRF